MVDEAKFRGGAQYKAVTTSGVTKLKGEGRVVRIEATVLGVIIELPPPRDLGNASINGRPFFIFFGEATSQPYTIQDPTGTYVATVDMNDVYSVLYETAPDGSWRFAVHDLTAARAENPHWNGIVAAGEGYSPTAFSQHMQHPSEVWSVGGTPMAGFNAQNGAGVSIGRDENYFCGTEVAGQPATPIEDRLLKFSRAGTWADTGTRTTVQYETPMAGYWYQKGYFFNGKGGQVEEYDPRTNTLAVRSTLPIARAWGAAVSLPVVDRILLIGGEPPLSPPWLYHPLSDTYEHTQEYVGLGRRKGTAGPYSNLAIYAGGSSFDPGDSQTYDIVDLYTPETRTWGPGPVLPGPRRLHGSFTIGGALYVIGGNDGTTTLSSVIKFAGIMWASTTPLNAPLQGICNSCDLASNQGGP